MDAGRCSCHEENPEKCRSCPVEEAPRYWCEVCRQAVAEKRCPLCGLKARKVA